MFPKAIPQMQGKMKAITLAGQIPRYEKLFEEAKLRSDKLPQIDRIIQKMELHRDRYQAVSKKVPNKLRWWFVGIIHTLECSSRFDQHLFNGDSLKARTRRVPKGQPKDGTPPFEWEFSALRALQYEGFHQQDRWDIPAVLYYFEKYNGFGYLTRTKINSPYLWSYTDKYTKGKYESDGNYNPSLVSQQAGAAALLKRMVGLKIVTPDTYP